MYVLLIYKYLINTGQPNRKLIKQNSIQSPSWVNIIISTGICLKIGEKYEATPSKLVWSQRALNLEPVNLGSRTGLSR